MKIPFHSRWNLAIKILPIVFFVIFAKFVFHYYNWEILQLSSLFTAVISANIFLIGFLISGVLVDFKESEKIPGEMAASLDAMADEGLIILKNKKSAEARAYLLKLKTLNEILLDWFHEKVKTSAVMKHLVSLNDDFLALESQTQANFIARLKQEQSTIRKLLTRAHTIRGTDFLGTGYAIAEIISTILVIGLVFIKIEPFYESLFFVSFVSFMLIYMIFFIKNLDNPFGYSDNDNVVENVSLKPLTNSLERLEEYSKE